jgi:hypothetical protein
LLSPVVNLIFLMLMRNTGIVHSPCSPVPFRSVSVGPLVSGVDLSQTKIPSPLTTMSTISNDALSALSESSRACIERLCKYEPEFLELTSPNQYVIRFVFFGPMRPRRRASDEANCLQYSTFLYATTGMFSRRYSSCYMNALPLVVAAGYACS